MRQSCTAARSPTAWQTPQSGPSLCRAGVLWGILTSRLSPLTQAGRAGCKERRGADDRDHRGVEHRTNRGISCFPIRRALSSSISGSGQQGSRVGMARVGMDCVYKQKPRRRKHGASLNVALIGRSVGYQVWTKRRSISYQLAKLREVPSTRNPAAATQMGLSQPSGADCWTAQVSSPDLDVQHSPRDAVGAFISR